MSLTLTSDASRRPRKSSRTFDSLQRVLDWYFRNRYGATEGPGTIPFYCDPRKVGAFAVPAEALARSEESATFRLFVTLAMYQALRDTVVMRHQRRIRVRDVRLVASLETLKRLVQSGCCPGHRNLLSLAEFCDIFKTGGQVDCTKRPGLACHVKDASRVFKRMGDLGKLPTSAYLTIWSNGGLTSIVRGVLRSELAPNKRAVLLVDTLKRVHRVGRKLATLFVSALSTPALAPAASPWFPEVNGNALVVIDTNVARAVDALRGARAAGTYDAREKWIRDQATHFDLSRYHSAAPSYSPRLLQQALYAFGSRSNRAALGDGCARAMGRCAGCAPRLCPFG